MPLANNYAKRADSEEKNYPLQVHVCQVCWLMQVPALADPEAIFSDYAYFSSYSATWRDHCAAFASHMTEELGLDAQAQVIEIASNDGFLLQQFQQRGVKVLGIEPARNIAAQANARGISTQARFFNAEAAAELAGQGIMADLMVANNVLAHVPDIHGFVAGFALLLKPRGMVSFEFPHVLELLRQAQFDTIYHEHYSYLSLTVVAPLLKRHGLKVVDVLRLPTHGGSLRILATHEAAPAMPHARVEECLREEAEAGLTRQSTYADLSRRAAEIKASLLALLRKAKAEGRRVVAYGAPAKGNTLLNYCGITSELVAYTVDANPEKQGRFLPGSRLPVHEPAYLLADKPDIVLILPWNIADEIMCDMRAVRDWGGRFLRAVPQVELL